MLAPLRSRRIVPWLAGLGLTVLVIYVVVRLLAFLQLFGKLGPHAGIEITQEQVLMLHNATDPDPRTPLIPPIVHHIFHNWKEPGKHDVPEDWARMRQSCIDKNPGWDMKVRVRGRIVEERRGGCHEPQIEASCCGTSCCGTTV